MDMLNYFAPKNLSLYELGFEEWLALPEPPFFDQIGDQDESHWLLLLQAVSLRSAIDLVLLVDLDGARYKLDGNVRKALWQSGKLPRPDSLLAQVFAISPEDFSALSHAKSIKNAQSLAPNEAIQAIYQELGLEFSSDRIKSGFIYDAINIALRGKPRNLQDKRYSLEKEEVDMRKAIKLFSQELALIDSLNPKPDLFVTGVLAACLIMLGTHRDLSEFLQRFNTGQVEYRDGLEDPVAGLIRVIQRHRADDHAMPSHLSIDLCRKAIQSITLWEEGRDSPLYWRRKLVSGVDHLPYVRALKRAKHIDGQRDL
jgi:hypothetical protein